MKSTQLKKHLLDNVSSDEGCIKAEKDGTFEVKRSYFYRHGRSAEGEGASIVKEAGSGWELVSTSDRWAAWPKTSYFVAIIRYVAPVK